jgi:hypothetical protein
MRNYHNPGLPGNREVAPMTPLPLFQWAATKAASPTSTSIPRAILRIAAKGRISLTHAAVIADLLGFASEARQ